MLLGLIAEDTSSKAGFMNSGLTVDRARSAVVALSGGKRKPHTGSDNIPFSREVRKTFEAATNVRTRQAFVVPCPSSLLLGPPACPFSSSPAHLLGQDRHSAC